MKESRKRVLSGVCVCALAVVSGFWLFTPQTPVSLPTVGAIRVSGQPSVLEIFDKAIEACGGKKLFLRVENVVWRGKLRAQLAGGERELDYRLVLSLPNWVRLELRGGLMDIIQFGSQDQFFVKTPIGTQPVPKKLKKQMFDGLWRELPYLFRQSDEVRAGIQDGGEEFFKGELCRILDISPPSGVPFRLLVNRTSFLPVGITHRFNPLGSSPAGGSALSEVTFADYREVSGLRLPFSTTIEHDGVLFQELSCSSIEVNAKLSASEFSPEG